MKQNERPERCGSRSSHSRIIPLAISLSAYAPTGAASFGGNGFEQLGYELDEFTSGGHQKPRPSLQLSFFGVGRGAAACAGTPACAERQDELAGCTGDDPEIGRAHV